MDCDLVIFGFSPYSLLLSYEFSKYDIKVVVLDSSRESYKNHLNKDSIIIYNGVSSFNDYFEVKGNSCYDFIKKICDDFNIYYEFLDYKLVVDGKTNLLKDSIIINIANVMDVLYRESLNNGVEFLFDIGFHDKSKIDGYFYINGVDNEVKSKYLIDMRYDNKYEYILNTYTLGNNNNYFNDFGYYKREEYDISFYKNLGGNFKIDIINIKNKILNYDEILIKELPKFNKKDIILFNIEYLKFLSFDKINLENLLKDKMYLFFYGYYYACKKEFEYIKEKLSLKLKEDLKLDVDSNKFYIDNKDFNEIICYCNLISKGDIKKLLYNDNVNNLNDVLNRMKCSFNGCIECHDKISYVISEVIPKSLNDIFDRSIVRIKSFNEI